MPSKCPCDRFTPHLFLKNGRCRDCDFLESEHITIATTDGRGRAATLEQKVDSLVKDGCTHYTPHAWLVDRCRDCGRPESVHLTSAGSIEDEAEDEQTSRRAVKHAPIRNAEEIAAMGSSSSRRSSQVIANAMKVRKGKKKTAGEAVETAAGDDDNDDDDDDEEDEEEEDVGSLEHAQRVMDKAVAQMMLMDQELEDVRAQEAQSLHSSSISQAEYDSKMAQIQAAFEAKEAELRAEVETAKAAIDAAQSSLRAQTEAAQAEAAREADARAAANDSARDELARMREEADRAREEAASLRAQAQAAASRAEEEREERDRARQADDAVRERSRQAELEAARAEAATARAEADTARAEAAQQREEQERRDRAAADERAAAEERAAEEREAAAAQKRAEAEEVKEEATQVTSAPNIVPVATAGRASTTTEGSAEPPQFHEEEEPQPTVAPASQPAGPYAGTVNLNDVLLKVEKLFLSGKNFFRFQYAKPGAVITALFLRVIQDEYVLCWSRGNLEGGEGVQVVGVQ